MQGDCSGDYSDEDIQMKTIVFDAGPLISLAMAGLADIIPKAKEKFNGEFIITPQVFSEVVQQPMQIKRFMLEALQINSLVSSGALTVIEEDKISEKTAQLMSLANSLYMAKGTLIRIVQQGEMSALAAASVIGSSAVVIDERTTRMILEAPEALRKIMEQRLRTKVELDRKRLEQFRQPFKRTAVIRSAELCFVAAEKGIVDDLLPEFDSGRLLAEAMLWSVKFSGCAISESEIAQAVRMFRRG